MATRRDTAKYTAFRIDRQSIRGSAAALLVFCQQKARQAESKGRLADAARPAQQNGVRQAAHLLEPTQLALDGLVAEEVGVRPRRRRR